MSKGKIIFSQDFYLKHLSIINTVHFTNREMDIIACLLHGRRTSKIASLLSIEPRTVETHIRNIMNKLECNTRECIIDFIEDSDKLSFVRKYYEIIQNEISFEKKLKGISKLNKDKASCCILDQEQDKNSFISYLKSHLELAGVSVKIAVRERKADYTLVIFPPILKEEEFPLLLKKITNAKNKVLIILQERKNSKEIPQELIQGDILYFPKETNYFFSFFSLLCKLVPTLNLDNVVMEFKDRYKKTESFSPLPQTSPNYITENRSNQRRAYLVSVCVLFFLIGCGIVFFSWDKKYNKKLALRSDLLIPTESAFLDRSELISQIDKAFKGNGGIQTIALVGIGGSGKTTLARQYTRKQNAQVIWEINAETAASVSESFEHFAHALSKNEEEKKILRELQEIKQTAEREKKLVKFVKEKLKSHSNWLLIYDNVEDFTDIQTYFPKDINAWGEGKIILTTRNHNIQNNNQVGRTILIGELSPTQKLNLFMQILQQGRDDLLTIEKSKELMEFLLQLPPFPLDISTAAYYIKTLNISYAEYLESLKQQDKDFTIVQENLLKEVGEYQKTRYAIIAHSLKLLLKSHQDFPALLLFIGLIDSQNIPKELLESYKTSSIIDNFIYNLKKHSLVTTQALPVFIEPTYSIHRSTQAIALSYLTKLLELNEKNPVLKEIAYTLDNYADKYIEQEDFLKMQIIARHLEKILSHSHLLSDFTKGLLESKLGTTYYFINNDKSKNLLDESLKIFTVQNMENLSSEDTFRVARSLLHIGAVYTELRFYKEAEELFKKAINIYEQGGTYYYADLSWSLAHLGNVYRRLGNYETAKDYLEKSIQLQKKYGNDNKRFARTLAYLGSVYRGLGLYQKSIDNLEESLAIYNKLYSNDHFRIGWNLTRLGNVYSDLGDFQKAKQYFEKGLLISKKYFPEDHISMGLTLTYLGNCYRELGEYKKSRDVLEESLKVHQKYFRVNDRRMGWILFHLATTYKALGKDHKAQKMYDKVLEIYPNYCSEDNIEVAGILRNMARIYLDRNRFDEAEGFIQKSLKILQSRQHVDAYRSLEVLGEIYLKKSIELIDTKSTPKGQHLKRQAGVLFHQALNIAEQNFPKNSIHIERIKSKTKGI